MAAIDIKVFGGIRPSVEPRNLPAEEAQTAHNLDLRFGDFRPVREPGESVETVPEGTISIHRTPSGVWLSSTTDTDYVNGQINDADSERVYLTGRSAYPEAWQDGEYRRLGVPAPTVAPTGTTVPGDQFTEEEYREALTRIYEEIVAASVASRSSNTLGNAKPTTGYLSAIWMAHGDDDELPTAEARDIAYAAPMTGATTTAASDAYLLTPALGGKQISYTGLDYWAVPMRWLATGYSINTATLFTALQAIKKPPENVEQLIPDASCTEIADLIAAIYDPAEDPAASLIAALNAAQAAVIGQVARSDTASTRADALRAAITALRTAATAVDSHYATLNSTLRDTLDTLLQRYVWIVPSATVRRTETRSYIYTYVTDWGEESAPSPPSLLITMDANDTFTVNISPPSFGAPYGTVTHWRLYRSTSSNTGASFNYVTEVAIDELTFDDGLLAEELQEPCQTATWIEPPADLIGLTGMPNGILVGFREGTNILCFSEPYHPYAWPEEYQHALQHNLVALGTFGQTCVALTEGTPVYASGADSASMALQVTESPQACISKRSAVSTEGGVLWASPDGICAADSTGVKVLTLQHYSKEDWQALGLENSFAAVSEGRYHLWTGEP